MKQMDLREGACRQHRTISLFAVIQCWTRGLDCIIFDTEQLKRLIGLNVFKKKRTDWLQEDMKELFPYVEVMWMSGSPKTFHSLCASRVPFPPGVGEEMNHDQRIQFLKQRGIKAEMLKLWETPLPLTFRNFCKDISLSRLRDDENYDEKLLSSYLSLLVQGQIPPMTFDDAVNENVAQPQTPLPTLKPMRPPNLFSYRSEK